MFHTYVKLFAVEIFSRREAAGEWAHNVRSASWPLKCAAARFRLPDRRVNTRAG
jgi:hypothetical protein